MKIEIKSWLDDSVLFSGEFGSLKLCVIAAVKSGADLSGADLAAQLGYPDGWHAFTHCTQGEQRVRVGCRDYTISEGRNYWSGKDNRREVLAALDYAEAIGKLRGWVK